MLGLEAPLGLLQLDDVKSHSVSCSSTVVCGPPFGLPGSMGVGCRSLPCSSIVVGSLRSVSCGSMRMEARGPAARRSGRRPRSFPISIGVGRPVRSPALRCPNRKPPSISRRQPLLNLIVQRCLRMVHAILGVRRPVPGSRRHGFPRSHGPSRRDRLPAIRDQNVDPGMPERLAGRCQRANCAMP
jgi:hypothetical protein